MDSVPAVLAVSNDAFIVYASNAFAILGLRALYFLLAGLLDKFISSSIPEIPSPVSLAVIVVILAVAIALSIRRPAAPMASAGTAAEGEDPGAPTDEPGRPRDPPKDT